MNCSRGVIALCLVASVAVAWATWAVAARTRDDGGGPESITFTCPTPADSAVMYSNADGGGEILTVGDTTVMRDITVICLHEGVIFLCRGGCDTIPAWLFRLKPPPEVGT